MLSINSKYLLDSKTFKSEFIDLLKQEGCIKTAQPDETSLSIMFGKHIDKMAEVSSASLSSSSYVDEDAYSDFVYAVYYRVLSSFVYMQYADAEAGLPSENQYIYQYIQEQLLADQAYAGQATQTSYESTMASLKIQYNIGKDFDQEAIVDSIENGYDSFDNYSIFQQKILEQEIHRRQATYSYSKAYDENDADVIKCGFNLTRYSYYREKKVKEYFQFIENSYNNIIIEQGLKQAVEHDNPTSITVYEDNINYFNINQTQKKRLLTYDDKLETIEIQTNFIQAIAQLLQQQTLQIAQIRDQIKLQIRKSYMRGTFLLISYIINEFLKYSISDRYGGALQTEDGVYLSTILNKSITEGGNVELIEYYDPTEYYNITRDVDAAAQKSNTVNDKFWDNVYNKIGQNTADLPLDEIDQFYKKQLKLEHNQVDDLVNFLSIIYEYGANNSYMSRKTDEFTTQISGRQIGDDPFYVGAPSSEISSIQSEILSVDSIKSGVEIYIQNGWQQIIDTTMAQLADLSTYVSTYYFTEISTANEQLEQQTLDQIESDIDEASQIADTLAEISGTYESLKTNSKYVYYLSTYYQDSSSGYHTYTELTNAYFIEKLFNFMLSVTQPLGLTWENTKLKQQVADLMTRYTQLSNDLYQRLFALSVWPNGYWQYYSPKYEHELTSVTTDLQSYLTEQIQVQHDGAMQHIQNHYDALLGYKEDIARLLADCDAAYGKYEAMKAGVEAVSKSSMDETLSETRVVEDGFVEEADWKWFDKGDKSLGGEYEYTETDKLITKTWQQTSEAIYSGDTIQEKLQKLEERSMYLSFPNVMKGETLLQASESPDENAYYTTKKAKTFSYKIDGEKYDDYYFVYGYKYDENLYYSLDTAQQPWAGAYSQSTASEIIATLDNACDGLKNLVALINSELRCIGKGQIDSYSRSDPDSVKEDVADAYEELIDKIDIFDDYVHGGIDDWQSLTSDSELAPYKNRLNRILAINLSTIQQYNIRYIDNTFFNLQLSVGSMLDSNEDYFDEYVNNDADRLDQQLIAISSYILKKDAQCSAEVLSAVNDISSKYLEALDEFNKFSLTLNRSEVDSIADDYAYSLKTILYRDEVYKGISASISQPCSSWSQHGDYPVRYRDHLDFLLSGDYIDRQWRMKLSGVMYWLSSASGWFEDSIVSKITEKIPTLPEYIQMIDLVNLAGSRYAPMVSDEQQLLVDKLDQIVEEFNAQITHISSQQSFYDESHEIYLKYNGTDIGYDPFYNYKNEAYSSYQIHPYLYNFVEKSNLVYPLANSFFISFGEEYEKELAQKGIDNILGKYGNIKDLWKSGMFDWTSYQSKYERQANLNNFNTDSTNPNTGFTGLFYPPALCAFLNDRDNFLQNVQDNTPSSYYYHLNLTDNQRQKIYNQLLAYEYMISCVATAQFTHNLSGEFDIYRYAEDCMGNSIFLLKSYKHLYEQHKDDPDYVPSYHEKRNTLGEVWMRAKDNPLAFPAFDVRDGYEDVAQYSIKKKTNSYAKAINSYILSLDLFFKNHEDAVSNPILQEDYKRSVLSTAYLTRDTIYEYQTSDSLANENDEYAPQDAQHLRCFFDFETDTLNQSLLLVVPFKTGTSHRSLYFNDNEQREDGKPKNRLFLKSSLLRYADSSIVVGYLGDHQLFNSMSDQTYVYNFSNDEYTANNVNVNNISNKQMLINGSLDYAGSSSIRISTSYFNEFIGFVKYKTFVYAIYARKMIDKDNIGSYTENASPSNAFTFIDGLKSKNRPRLTISYVSYKCRMEPIEKTTTTENLLYDCYDWHSDSNKISGIDYANASNIAVAGGEGKVVIGFVTERYSKTDSHTHDYTNTTQIVNFAEYTTQIEDYNTLSNSGMNLEYPRSTALIQTDDSQHINIYNSFDSFVQHVVDVTFKFVGTNLRYDRVDYYNLNSDIGYLPQYVDVQGKTWYCNNTALSGSNSLKIELLGPEKSDIAFTPVIQMTTDDKYGRITEDYREYNKMSAFNATSITIPSKAIEGTYEFDLHDIYMSATVGGTTGSDKGKAAQAETSWAELVETPELLQYKYILYNKKYLAQPILKGNLSDVLPNGYYYQGSELYDLLSGEEVIGPNTTTYQNINMTNHIDGILSIGLSIGFDESTGMPSKIKLTARARMPDDENDRVIDKDNFYLLIYVKNTVKTYQYYHIFENANKNIASNQTSVLSFYDAKSVDLSKTSADLSSIATDSGKYLFKSVNPGAKHSSLSAMAEFKYSEEDPINREFPFVDPVDIEDEITIVQNESQSIYFFAVDSYKALDLGVVQLKTFQPGWVDDKSEGHTYYKKINTALPKYRQFYNNALVIEATYNLERTPETKSTSNPKDADYEIVQYFNYKNYTNPQYVHIDWGNDSTVAPSSYVCNSTDEEIKSTYLVLRPGESGRLDIRVDYVDYQKLTKNAISQSIVGAQSEILKTYYIMNVSDEKPKFIVSRSPFIADDCVEETSNYELEDQYYSGMKFRYAMMVIEDTRISYNADEHPYNYVAMSQIAFTNTAGDKFDFPASTTVEMQGADAKIVYPNIPGNLIDTDEDKEFFASDCDWQASALSIVIDMKSEALDITQYTHWEWYNSHCSNSHIGYIPKVFMMAFSNDKTRWYEADRYNDIKNAIPTTNYVKAYSGELDIDEDSLV